MLGMTMVSLGEAQLFEVQATHRALERLQQAINSIGRAQLSRTAE